MFRKKTQHDKCSSSATQDSKATKESLPDAEISDGKATDPQVQTNSIHNWINLVVEVLSRRIR
jgi:hypothetical protein